MQSLDYWNQALVVQRQCFITFNPQWSKFDSIADLKVLVTAELKHNPLLSFLRDTLRLLNIVPVDIIKQESHFWHKWNEVLATNFTHYLLNGKRTFSFLFDRRKKVLKDFHWNFNKFLVKLYSQCQLRIIKLEPVTSDNQYRISNPTYNQFYLVII